MTCGLDNRITERFLCTSEFIVQLPSPVISSEEISLLAPVVAITSSPPFLKNKLWILGSSSLPPHFDLALTLIQLNLVLVCPRRLIFQNSAGSFKYFLNVNCSLAILFLWPFSGLHLASVFCSWRLRSRWQTQTHTCPQRLFLICFFTIVRVLLSSAVVFVGLIVPLWLQGWCL